MAMGFHFVFLGDSANVTLSCVNILPGLDISSSLVSLLPLLTSHSMPKCMSISLPLPPPIVHLIGHTCDTLTQRLMLN